MTRPATATLDSRIESLPPLPEVVHGITQLTDDPDASIEDVVALLKKDATASTMILRVANSSYCGASRQMTQLSRAVAMLGIMAVRNFVIALHARRAWVPSDDSLPEYETVWQHSIAVASAAEIITRFKGMYPPEAAFVAGLLHDVGQMAMVVHDRDAFRTVLAEQDGTRSLLEIEREHFGIDHAEAGYRILGHWGLAEGLSRIARRHHDTEIDPDDELVATVALADVCAHLLGLGFDVRADHSARAAMTSQILGLTETDQLRTLDRLEQRAVEATTMLLSTDAAPRAGEFEAVRSARWVSHDAECNKLGQLLLEHQGYSIVHAAPDALGAPNDDLVVVAAPDAGTAGTMAADLAARGWRRLVVLTDPHGDAPRRCDPATGTIAIPTSFTAFDIEWAETRLAEAAAGARRAS